MTSNSTTQTIELSELLDIDGKQRLYGVIEYNGVKWVWVDREIDDEGEILLWTYKNPLNNDKLIIFND